MKFTSILPVVATLCTVLANGEGSYSRVPTVAQPVSFTEAGVSNAIHVGVKSSKGDTSKYIAQAAAFAKRNPKLVQSAMAEADKKEYDQVKAEAMKVGLSVYKAKNTAEYYEAKDKAIDYTYEHPEFLNMIQKVLFRVVKDHPTVVDDLFATAEKVAEKDPSIVMTVKDQIISISESSPKVYKEVTEMVIKTALIDPKLSGKVFVNLLKVDRIGCTGMAAMGCDKCDGGEASSTSPTKPEPTQIDDGSAEPAGEGAGELAPDTTTAIPGDYSKPENSPAAAAEGAGELAPEAGTADEADVPEVESAETSPAAKEPEAATEGAGEAVETSPTIKKGSYSKPLSYARPAVAAQ